MSIHHDQIATSIRNAVQLVLQRGVQDPRVRGLISITRVTLSPDGDQATVFLSVLPAKHAELSVHGIQHAAKHIRSQVAGMISMRRMPRLHFRLDDSLKKQATVFDAINATAPSDNPSADDTSQSNNPSSEPGASTRPVEDPSS